MADPKVLVLIEEHYDETEFNVFNSFFPARRVNDRDDAPELRAALVIRHGLELAQQLFIIAPVVGRLAGEPGRMKARPAAQGIDLQARVVGNGDAAGMQGDGARFFKCIFLKGCAVLINLGTPRKIPAGKYLNAVATE